MAELTQAGQTLIADMARRHGVSEDAALTVLRAVASGGGTQAQFNHSELGGMGQWSLGGMTMVGDMFNNALKSTVDSLCSEASNALAQGNVFAPPPAPSFQQGQQQGVGTGQGQYQGGGGQMQMQGGGGFGGAMGTGTSLFIPGGATSWWPADLGQPASTGAQNDMRYAHFPQAQRLAISVGGAVTVYDTGTHQIGGFGQQQGGDQSLTFTSQFGTVRVADLPVVSPGMGPGMGSETGSGTANGDTAASSSQGNSSPQAVEPPSAQLQAPLQTAANSNEAAPGDQGADPATGWQAQGNVAPAAGTDVSNQTDAANPAAGGPPQAPTTQPHAPASQTAHAQDIIATIEQLAALKEKGVLTEDEFNTKKTELLSRL